MDSAPPSTAVALDDPNTRKALARLRRRCVIGMAQGVIPVAVMIYLIAAPWANEAHESSPLETLMVIGTAGVELLSIILFISSVREFKASAELERLLASRAWVEFNGQVSRARFNRSIVSRFDLFGADGRLRVRCLRWRDGSLRAAQRGTVGLWVCGNSGPYRALMAPKTGQLYLAE